VSEQVCPACGAVHFRNAKPCAGGIIERDGRVLLGRRNREPYLDWWDIPGGFLEPWEDPADAAVREVREETGLEVRPRELFGMFVDTYGEDEDADYTLNFYYLMDVVSGDPHPADDLAELAWFAVGALPERIAFPNARLVLDLWERRALAPTKKGPPDPGL
jgi:ADP-ribose pyrophosphatase YjhB (NUDIX family)